MWNEIKLTATIAAILLALLLVPAKADATDGYAIIEIPHPVNGSLMQLAGIAGRGTALIKMPNGEACRAMRVRFVAGGFWGLDPSAQVDAIQIVVENEAAIERLMRGRELISEDYSVEMAALNQSADISVLRGVPDGSGFIINPGTSTLADVFGPRVRRVSCRNIVRAYARLAR